MAKPKAPNLTRDEIERWLELDAQARALGRQKSDLEKQRAKIGEKLLAYAQAKTEDGVTAARCGHVIVIETKLASVQWKDEFIRVESLEAAEAIIAAQPEKKSAYIQRPE